MIPDWRIFINIATTPIKHGGGCFPGRAYIHHLSLHYLWMALVLSVQVVHSEWMRLRLVYLRRDGTKLEFVAVVWPVADLVFLVCSLVCCTRCLVSISRWHWTQRFLFTLLLPLFFFFLQIHSRSGRLHNSQHAPESQTPSEASKNDVSYSHMLEHLTAHAIFTSCKQKLNEIYIPPWTTPPFFLPVWPAP